ncbi:hypothetical protein HMPREF0580_2126 [Mobiluncus mulieris ATCC 35239]|uniref:Uncharacterized protein n=1 Tax=Mobiluncus mulieris ATCC 35239 TaxID=871571 RepID=E0QTB1_9ACTO|nr:hypothetical protein HMPREF0577_1487 [Mobiluncus mulieris ATCC 35243]EFM45237.1 hypothetical protein HMPREF0580_2126 [Mobiluncus mulieris ATCC 35239]
MKTITLGLPLFCWHLVSRVLSAFHEVPFEFGLNDIYRAAW